MTLTIEILIDMINNQKINNRDVLYMMSQSTADFSFQEELENIIGNDYWVIDETPLLSRVKDLLVVEMYLVDVLYSMLMVTKQTDGELHSKVGWLLYNRFPKFYKRYGIEVVEEDEEGESDNREEMTMNVEILINMIKDQQVDKKAVLYMMRQGTPNFALGARLQGILGDDYWVKDEAPLLAKVKDLLAVEMNAADVLHSIFEATKILDPTLNKELEQLIKEFLGQTPRVSARCFSFLQLFTSF